MSGDPVREEPVSEASDREAVPAPETARAAEAPPETTAPGSAAADLMAELQDKYLRLAAEFDNYRKRMARERAELWGKAQADLVARLAEALDDLARFAGVDAQEADPRTIQQGVDMVARKLWKQLDAAGVQRVDQAGVPFDPSIHEAVTTTPAAAPEQDRLVASVLEPGYRLGETLIRPARVVVQVWSEDAGAPVSPPPSAPAS